MSQTNEEIQAIRVFVAVAINEDARKELALAQKAMQRISAGIGWVAPPNIHLTLVFLGDVFNNTVPAIEQAIDGVATAHPPCALAIRGLGSFGNPAAPKVIWAGLQGDIQPLMALQADLVAALKTAGLSPDTRKAFHPHLTLGRARSGRPTRDLAEFIRSRAEQPFGRLDVQRVLLIQSRLTPRGPIYTTLHDSPLNNSHDGARPPPPGVAG